MEWLTGMDMVFYVPKLDRIYCVAEANSYELATYTDNAEYPLYWWNENEFNKYWKSAIYLGEL